MSRFAPILPELILSIGGTILMMVAAFAGRRGSGVTSWLAVALLGAATVALIGAPSHAGPLFDGFVSADLFASFGKAIMFPAAAVFWMGIYPESFMRPIRNDVGRILARLDWVAPAGDSHLTLPAMRMDHGAMH